MRGREISKIRFLGQFLTLNNMVLKFSQNSNFSYFLGIKSEIYHNVRIHRGHRTLNICVQCSNVRSCSANIRTHEHWSGKKIKEHSKIEHSNIWMPMNIRTLNIFDFENTEYSNIRTNEHPNILERLNTRTSEHSNFSEQMNIEHPKIRSLPNIRTFEHLKFSFRANTRTFELSKIEKLPNIPTWANIPIWYWQYPLYCLWRDSCRDLILINREQRGIKITMNRNQNW